MAVYSVTCHKFGTPVEMWEAATPDELRAVKRNYGKRHKLVVGFLTAQEYKQWGLVQKVDGWSPVVVSYHRTSSAAMLASRDHVPPFAKGPGAVSYAVVDFGPPSGEVFTLSAAERRPAKRAEVRQRTLAPE